MSRYIDADALTSHIRHIFFELINKAEPIMTDDGGAFDLKIVNPLLEANKAIASIIREQPTADVVEVVRCKDCKHAEQRWIPIKWHDCTDEDREKYGFSNDIVAVFDCEMPDDDQPILVTTSHGYVIQDVCYIDDGFSLDSGWDWIDDIKAWMPLPQPYKAESEDKE